ncbi:PilX N-terminal domain-containing pilus assembly protein [Neisseria sp.]|uniref:pilus assembly PilX family protein n=1 Tax=Neisseria sp. TaxID=192066 RepID=UPI00359F31CC
MRRPNCLNQTKHNQQGFALFIVLMIMIVIALLVVAATQSYNTEQRISSNDADRKLAMSVAEAALRQGESEIVDLQDKDPSVFKDDCTDGYCTTSANDPAWKRAADKDSKPYIEENGREYKTGDAKARYITEYINTDAAGSKIYRVTAKAWGKNENTVVMLQSYVASE